MRTLLRSTLLLSTLAVGWTTAHAEYPYYPCGWYRPTGYHSWYKFHNTREVYVPPSGTIWMPNQPCPPPAIPYGPWMGGPMVPMQHAHP
jgi:hypothetical protein